MAIHEMWHKFPEETSKEYRAFCDYRDMGAGGGKRSMQRLADDYNTVTSGKGKKNTPTQSHETLQKWSAKNNWQDRVKAFDEDQLILREEARKEEEAERENRRIELRAIWFDRETTMIEELAKAMEDLRKYTKSIRLRLGEDSEGIPIHVAKSSPADVRAMIGAHADLAKLVAFILGDPTEIMEQRVTSPLMALVSEAKRRIGYIEDNE